MCVLNVFSGPGGGAGPAEAESSLEALGPGKAWTGFLGRTIPWTGKASRTAGASFVPDRGGLARPVGPASQAEERISEAHLGVLSVLGVGQG
jgi:hypothetical protein